ncbi:histidine kinase [Streptomyces sp. JJ66]|uniref:sensor histidine kinase n=1 Tax=Streptomyces sp. JJ66 TaxID=2803843 RepID=UPI001C59B3A2|nr:histidine kinase [Streptomyces sp. JJ66]MBW1602488.1 histidine kinase [Streptomyces sp. JJ66]
MRERDQAFGGLPAPRIAKTIAVATLGYYALIVVLNVVRSDPDRTELLLSLGCVTVLFAAHSVVHTAPGAREWPLWVRVLTLTGQAALTCLPFLAYGLSWGSMGGPLAGSLFLLLPGRAALPLVGVILLAVLGAALDSDADAVGVVYLVASTLMAGLILYGMARLAHLVTEVHATRREMARMAVCNERLRFSRDLHDLLGYSLSAISLKSELAHRLAPVDADRAQQEIASVSELSRRALSDVRMVAHAYRSMSLRAELTSAEMVLKAADIDVTTSAPELERLDSVIDSVLAIALREGVTNILRHSKAERCRITLRQRAGRLRFVVENDGVPSRSPVREPHSGSGLGNLADRLAAVGGSAHADRPGAGTFQLVVEAPVAPCPGLRR